MPRWAHFNVIKAFIHLEAFVFLILAIEPAINRFNNYLRLTGNGLAALF